MPCIEVNVECRGASTKVEGASIERVEETGYG
jgi:hypothetical protein